MADFTGEDLAGSRFRGVDLTNSVDVVPLVEAELDRRYPDRAAMRPVDAEGFRAAWAILERLWPQTVERARSMAPEQLHERVEGEWSFIETLRHLIFATDAWVVRAILGSRHRGIRSICRTTRCPTNPAFLATQRHDRRWRRCSCCAPTGWPRRAECSKASLTSSWSG